MATNGSTSCVPGTPNLPTVIQRGSIPRWPLIASSLMCQLPATTPHDDRRSPRNQNPTPASSLIINLGKKNAPSNTAIADASPSPNQNRDSQGTTIATPPVFADRNAELDWQWEVTKCTKISGRLKIGLLSMFTITSKPVQLILPG